MSPLPSLITAVPSLAALTLDTVRTFLHLLGVAGWVGGQILMRCSAFWASSEALGPTRPA